MLTRFLITCWVGAAALFVITTIVETRSPLLDSETKGLLALMRFPHYYQFGFATVGAAWLFGWFAKFGRARYWCYQLLLSVVLVLMLVDYFVIYLPLEEMLKLAEAARPANFQTLHEYSKQINHAHVSGSLLAALIVCWPNRVCQKSETTNQANEKDAV